MKPAKNTPTAYAPLFTFLGTGKNAIVADGEIVVVNFAGLGGACAGIEDALHRPVTHAINHDPIAISLHRTNNPHTIHHVQDVWEVDPLEVAGGRRIALAWFSPDCKHFSKAKGGKPVEKNIRDLAWVTTRYTALPDHLKPRTVFLENVEEFKTWGPLTEDGQPCKVRQGETFKAFVRTIESHGYEVEWRELRACDYGAPTIRKRLFLIARCDGLPIVWPAPTHGKPGSPAVEAGQLLPWRTAAECIDWSLPTPSIFDRKRPLVTATLRRVARGIKKFVLETGQPFIVTANHAGPQFRGQDIHEPFRTITSAHDAHGLVDPLLAPVITNKQHGNPARSALTPLSTITTNHNKNEVVTGYLVPRYGERHNQPPRVVSVEQPGPTVVNTANGSRLATASLVKHFGGFYEGAGIGLDSPAHSITAVDHHALLVSSLLRIDMRGFDKIGAAPVNAPLNTIHTKQAQAVTVANLVQYNGTSDAQAAGHPIPTLSTVERFGLTCATLTRHFGTSHAADVAAPLGTITALGGGKTNIVTTTCLA